MEREEIKSNATERKITNLLDFQHFQLNPKLKSVLQDVESRYAGALDDDALDLVSAAGTASIPTVQVEPLLARHDIPDDERRKTW